MGLTAGPPSRDNALRTDLKNAIMLPGASFPEILVFLHVPRSGGTALHNAFSSHFPPDRICPERMNRLQRVPQHALAHYRLFSGHYRFEQLAVTPQPRLMVTVLREPRQRLVSLYRHWRRHSAMLAEGNPGLRLARSLPLAEFLRSDRLEVVEAFDNNLARQLAGNCHARGPGYFTRITPDERTPLDHMDIVPLACRNLLQFEAVGFQSSLDVLLAYVSQRMGWPPPASLPLTNASSRPDPELEGLPEEDIPPDALPELNRLTRLDRMVWDFALRRARGQPLLLPGAG
jgi:hypothetical protein